MAIGFPPHCRLTNTQLYNELRLFNELKAQYVGVERSWEWTKAQPVGNGKENALQSLGNNPVFGVKVHIKIPTLADTIVSNKGRYYGAGDRTRTGTSVTSRDFKSLVSTYSTTPAGADYFR